MRIVHVIDPSSPGGGACALAELAGVQKQTRDGRSAVVLLGTRHHEELARRCGVEVHMRAAVPWNLPLIARKVLARRGRSLVSPASAVVAWTARSAMLAVAAWPHVPVVCRMSVGPMGASGFLRTILKPAARSVSVLAATHALKQVCERHDFDSQRMTVVPPAVDLLAPGIAARADVRGQWMRDFGMAQDTFVVGLLGEPVAWPDARMAVEIVARLALAGRNVRMLMHPSAGRRIEALTLLKWLKMSDLVMEADELAEPWTVLSGMDAALVLGVDFRAVGNAIRTAVRPGVPAARESAAVAHGTSRRPSPSVSTIAWCFAAGVPVVAHDLPSNREMIEHDVTGFVVAEHDMNAASDRLAQLHDHWPLRQRLTTAASEVARERFSMPQFAERLAAACEDVASGRLIGRAIEQIV